MKPQQLPLFALGIKCTEGQFVRAVKIRQHAGCGGLADAALLTVRQHEARLVLGVHFVSLHSSSIRANG